ncbi:MAG TPA: hypothetical protein DCL84_11315 [Eubacterium sp.]|jgi:hypothetical protein|nr:hypothetical protein [Eubacterium sp.]
MRKNNIKKKIDKPDTAMKTFWRNNERFADLFNAVAFNGRQVINPDELTEMDTDVSGIIQFTDYNESLVRTRDIIKKFYNGIEFTILGLELQTNPHYAMPVRALLYDGLGYLKECNEFRNLHRTENDFDSDKSFLSGINKSDKIHPIITLIFYYGESPWDGPVRLSDMMTDIPEELHPLFSDYKINLVQILDSGRYQFYNEDVKSVFDITQKIYTKNLQGLSEEYTNKPIDSEIINLITTITGFSKLSYIFNESDNGGETAMWKCVEEMENEWVQKGVAEGQRIGERNGELKGMQKERQTAIITMIELGLTKEQILTKYSEEDYLKAEKALNNK